MKKKINNRMKRFQNKTRNLLVSINKKIKLNNKEKFMMLVKKIITQ